MASLHGAAWAGWCVGEGGHVLDSGQDGSAGGIPKDNGIAGSAGGGPQFKPGAGR